MISGQTHLSKELLLEIREFLSEKELSNEHTEYDPSQERLVNAIVDLVKQEKKTSITEDFDTPFVHPMITIQKWVSELLLLTDEALVHHN